MSILEIMQAKKSVIMFVNLINANQVSSDEYEVL